MCECHDSEEEHELWMAAETAAWAEEYRREKTIRIPEPEMCVCGHGIEYHKHAEECRHVDCISEGGCKLFKPA